MVRWYSDTSLNKKSRQHRHDNDILFRKPKSNSRTETVTRISMSLPPELLAEFDKTMLNTGFSDRSKAIQTALHSFIDQNRWNNDKGDTTTTRNGAGAIMVLYDNHTYGHDNTSTHIQHRFNDIISATTHMHLDHNNCLEVIMVRGKTKRIKELAKNLSENRGIKSMRVHFVSVV